MSALTFSTTGARITPSEAVPARPPLVPLLALLGFAVVCLALECTAHTDDTDAALYTVVARHMVEDGTWTQLRYLENVHPTFREHLPFGLWPSAAAVRLVGEGALPWLSAVWTLLTVALTVELGRRLANWRVGLLAGFFLITTEQFVFTGALARLDPPLIFFSLLSATPVLISPRSVRSFFVVTLCAGLACAIKGPFGLVLPVAATAIRAIRDRDARWLVFGGAATALATLPTFAFLILTTDATWRSGYVDQQLLASATGTRSDGERSPLFPAVAVALHFWPWLPLLAVAVWKARVDPLLRTVLGWALVVLLVLAIPSRKLWHHTLLVFPLLSLAIARIVPQVRSRLLPFALVVVGTATVFTLRWVQPPRAVSCLEFSPSFSADQPVAVIRSESLPFWRELAVLSRDVRARPWLASDFGDVPKTVELALAPDSLEPPPGWQTLARARGWRLSNRSR